MNLPLVKMEIPRCATPRVLGSPRGSPRPRVEDASYRLLQPTYDTSTRMIGRLTLEPTVLPAAADAAPAGFDPAEIDDRHRTTLRQSGLEWTRA